jgi:hypothetical protein
MKCFRLQACFSIIGVAMGIALIARQANGYLENGHTFASKKILLVQSEQEKLPEIVIQGLELYSKGKVKEATKLWGNNVISFLELLETLPLSDSPQQQQEIEKQINNIRQQLPLMEKMMEFIYEQAGVYSGYEVIKSYFPRERTWIVYLKLKHKETPVFLEFVLGKINGDWKIEHFHFTPDIRNIIPEEGSAEHSRVLSSNGVSFSGFESA